MNLDGDNVSSDTSAMKEWKSFYFPHHHQLDTNHQSHGSNGIPQAWSNGVINNNNLLTVGSGFHTGVGGGHTGAAGSDLGFKPSASTVQCLLFGVIGLVTFLLNSVMALLLSVKLPGLEGLLGTLLGGVGLGGLGLGGLGILNKQEVVAADTQSKHLEYVLLPEHNHVLVDNNLQSGDNLEYFDKNR